MGFSRVFTSAKGSLSRLKHFVEKLFFHKNSIGSDNLQLKSMPYEERTGRTLFRGQYENIYG